MNKYWKDKYFRISIISFLIYSIFWIIGDILIVGFKPEPNLFPEIMNSNIILNKNAAIWSITGSESRLRYGAIIADFSTPLMILGLYFIYQILKPSGKKNAFIISFLFLMSFSYSPFAHASFYYPPRVFKTALELSDSKNILFLIGNEFEKLKTQAWLAAIITGALAWILFSITIIRKKTDLPIIYGIISPIALIIILTLIQNILPWPLNPLLNGAALNLGIFIYCLILIFHFKKIDYK